MVGGTLSNLKHKRNRRAFVALTASFTTEPIQQEHFVVRKHETDQLFKSTKHALLNLQPAHQSWIKKFETNHSNRSSKLRHPYGFFGFQTILNTMNDTNTIQYIKKKKNLKRTNRNQIWTWIDI
jgi:hypothetical protein